MSTNSRSAGLVSIALMATTACLLTGCSKKSSASPGGGSTGAAAAVAAAAAAAGGFACRAGAAAAIAGATGKGGPLDVSKLVRGGQAGRRPGLDEGAGHSGRRQPRRVLVVRRSSQDRHLPERPDPEVLPRSR